MTYENLEECYINIRNDKDTIITSRDLKKFGKKTLKSKEINVPKLDYNLINQVEYEGNLYVSFEKQ